MADRPYLFFELTNSLCSTCLRKVEAKVIFEGELVFLSKRCPQHGPQKVLISSDAAYYRQQRNFLKPGQMPLHFGSPLQYGCPYDCGLCPDHEQHSCLTLIEVGDACNLSCPICYAESGPHRPNFRSLAEIEAMLDRVVRNEGEPDVVQISGGEPTLHPDFFAILDLAKARPIRHLMVNTNGLRIAREPDFARRLAEYQPGFEIYLQFDSLHDASLRPLRGADLAATRLQALERLNRHDLSTTLVVTLMQGVNDGEIGEILEFAVAQPCVRGVTFQPVQIAGRTLGFDPAKDRLTLGCVRRKILEQFPVFTPEDILPVPCHPDCIAMAYALKLGGELVPLTRLVGAAELLGGPSTIVYEKNAEMRAALGRLFSTSASPDGSELSLRQLLCCLPQVDAPQDLGYRNIFRVIVMQFLDAYNFDVRSVKRSCVHIAHPDGRIIPFDTYNLFFRDEKASGIAALREAAAAQAW